MDKNRKKKWIVTGSILLVFCGGLWLYNRYGKTDGPIAPTEAPVATGQKKILNVNGLVLRPQTFTDAISVIGNLLPDEEVDLSFETSGKIVEINFREGTPVRKGDLLAKVNDRPLQAQLSRYEAQLKLAETASTARAPCSRRTPSARRPTNRPVPNWRSSTPTSPSSGRTSPSRSCAPPSTA